MSTDRRLAQYEILGNPDGTFTFKPNPCGAWVRAPEAFDEIDRLRATVLSMAEELAKEWDRINVGLHYPIVIELQRLADDVSATTTTGEVK